jgi:RTX calcium-binding nonapeptide repeat (4 copies)
MASSRHWLSRRTSKLPHRARRPLLMVERLEKRELLNGSPLPLLPQEPPVQHQVLALPNPLANPPANSLLPGHGLPSGVSQPPFGGLPNPASPGGPQPPVGLSSGGIPGPIQKSPANSKAPAVNMPIVVGPDQSTTPNGQGYTPAQMRQAYGFNQITLPTGETFDDAGRGQTIAIIDGLDDPYIASDLQTFDETFNIGGAAHDPTNTGFFKVVNEYGGSTLPPTDNGQVDYGLETSLDVEWAHAMAPGANILVVEISTPFGINDLNTAIDFAARQPGVSVVSMSFGYSEFPTDYYFDNIFTTPVGHQGVSYVSSAGDSGGLVSQYQAISPNVVSVGGTTLPADATGDPARALEFGWAPGGGGISATEAEPAYQLGVQSTGERTGPDLAYDSDPNTGVPIIDTLYANANSPGEPWIKIGGTSMAAPQISSLVAIANQLRAAAGEGTLDGPNQLLPAIYQIAANDPNAFQDITSGNNGYSAGPGYDFATGVGTPNAQYLVPDLVAAYSTPALPATLYWTGDASTNWDTPGNWSTVDPAVTNIQQSILPSANDQVVVALSGATILHDTTNYDAISRFTVTAANVTLDLGAGTLDLSGAGGRGTFQVDQAGDAVTMEAGVLKSALVTSGTTLFATLGSNSDYPELNDVRLDGTVNADQSGNNNGIYILNGLILNGTIKLGGGTDLSSVLLAGYVDPFVGNQDNNPETISGSGTIQLGQSQDGDALYNWGTLGTFTIGTNVTVVGGGPGSTAYYEQTSFTGGLDNQGTLEENGGSLQIAAFGPALDGWEPSGTTGWTNEGNIEATGAILSLLGGWINNGAISADSASTVYLGNPTYGQLPSSPDAAYYAWSSIGSVTIANGATVVAGGFLTSDQFQSASSIPGVTADLSMDSPSLDGTLDNSPADNPVLGGVLAANAVTGPLRLIGGRVNGGSITTSGSGDVQVVAATIPYGPLGFAPLTLTGGSLYNLTNDGTVDVTGLVLTLFNVTDSGAINGTGGATVEFSGTWDNTNGSISVDSASSLYLGTPASTDPNFPPTLADGSAYAWSLSKVGTITVSDGATISFGGLMTADQFTAFRSLPGVSIDLSRDTVILAGWLDDSPADNPDTGGVLALTSETGPVDLAGGFIYQGTITSSGTGALDAVDFVGLDFNGIGVLDGVTNDGTIAVLSNSVLYLEGAVTNNGTFAASIGLTLFLPGGSFTNNGSLKLTNNLDNHVFLFCNSSMVNHGTIALDDAAFEVFPFDSQSPPVTLTNTGTIVATDFSEIIVTCGLRNTGTISGTMNSTLLFQGTWDNTTGTIRVDSASALFLGFPTYLDPNYPYPPPITDFSPYALNLSQVGEIDVANGARFGLDGLMTTDQFDAFPSLPGVSVNLSRDTVFLQGWLDNSPADNPTSHGVLAINASTGPLYLDDGYVYQGKITTSGSNDLETADTGFLDGVEMDGNLNVTGLIGEGTIIVLNSLTLNGTIEMPGSFGRIGFGYFDDTPETIRGTGTIFLGESGTDEALLFDLNIAGLTIDSGITIDAGATYCEFAAEGSTIENLGTVEDNTASSTLYTYGISPTTGELYEGIANYSAGTLTGGTWEVSNGAVWNIYGFDLTTNSANLSVSGAGTEILDTNAANALAGFTTNTATGNFTVGTGYNFTAPGAFSNAGVVNIQTGASFSTESGNYSQSAGLTTVDDTLTAANVLINGGSLEGTGTITGNLTNAAVVFPGDAPGMLTIQGNFAQTAAGALDINLAGPPTYGQLAVSGTAALAGALDASLISGFTPAGGAWFTILTFATRSGNFSTENGLTLSKNMFFVPSYRGEDLTLVLGPGVSVVTGTDLYIIGGLASNDRVQIKPIGGSNTGSTGVQVTATLNGASSTTTLSQVFGAIYVFGFAGNDAISVAATLTICASITAGNGNDHVTAGNGSNTVTLGNGNDNVQLGDGDNTVTLGHGNDNTKVGNGNNVVVAGNGNDNITAGNGSNTVTLSNGNDNAQLGDGDNTVTLGHGNDNTKVGNGNNVVVEGDGNDNITAGNGDNLIVAGLGHHSVHAGNGSNILIDGNVSLTESDDSLWKALDDWIQYGSQAANVASIRSRLAVTYNTSHANTLDAGTGLDWFWVIDAKDSTNRKATDLLN